VASLGRITHSEVTGPTGEECGWVLTGYLQECGWGLTGYLQGIEHKKARLAEDRVT
jgi:hypothetical protein